jgi:hypothetical protein
MDRVASTGQGMPVPAAAHKILLLFCVFWFLDVAGLQQIQA